MISRTLSFNRVKLLSAILRQVCLCPVTLYPRNFRQPTPRHGALVPVYLKLEFLLQIAGHRIHRMLSCHVALT